METKGIKKSAEESVVKEEIKVEAGRIYMLEGDVLAKQVGKSFFTGPYTLSDAKIIREATEAEIERFNQNFYSLI